MFEYELVTVLSTPGHMATEKQVQEWLEPAYPWGHSCKHPKAASTENRPIASRIFTKEVQATALRENTNEPHDTAWMNK